MLVIITEKIEREPCIPIILAIQVYESGQLSARDIGKLNHCRICIS
jgi:hypothetical protein